MARLFLADRIEGKKAYIGRDARHIKALRLKKGDNVLVLDNERAFEGKITKFGKVIEVDIDHEVKIDSEFLPKLAVAFGVLKKGESDDVVKSLAEIGVDLIIPFISSRCETKLDGERAKNALERWRRIVAEVPKCTKVANIPKIHPVTSFNKVLKLANKFERKIILWERSDKALEMRGSDTIVLVGPEGGFSEDEVEEARKHSFDDVGLGRRILKASLACVYIASVFDFFRREGIVS